MGSVGPGQEREGSSRDGRAFPHSASREPWCQEGVSWVRVTARQGTSPAGSLCAQGGLCRTAFLLEESSFFTPFQSYYCPQNSLLPGPVGTQRCGVVPLPEKTSLQSSALWLCIGFLLESGPGGQEWR